MTAKDATDPRRRRVPITRLLVFGFGGLVFLAVAGVLVVTLGVAARNTFGLLEDKSRLLLTSVTERTRQFLDPAEAQAEFVARLLESGEIVAGRPEELVGALRVALAATPQVFATVYLDEAGWMVAVQRGTDSNEVEIGDWRAEEEGQRIMAEAERRGSREAFWGVPFYAAGAGTTIVNLRRPVWKGGRFVGLIASAVTVQELSRFVAGLETESGQQAFILYGQDRVLAHRALEWEVPELSTDRPLPGLLQLGDPVLAEIWSDGFEERSLIAGSGHAGTVAGIDYVYLYAPLADYGEVPWMVGSYFREEDVADQFRRLVVAAVAGLVALIVAVGFATLIGRKVSRPIGDLAAAAVAIRDLDLDQAPRLRRSRLREIDQAASAFNAMVGALRVFSLYVPKKVVHALIRRRDAAALRSVSREVTVMFTDIAGFTRRVEALSAEQTAAFLNHHFDLVTAAIEAEGGIVDKYIGDGVMALWGALDEQPDHPLRAVRAALAIATAVRQDNRRSERPVRLRIGIHSGEVVVGNIGAPARMNFTVVGDNVNLAERLQTLGKTVAPEDEVVVLLSATTADAVGASAPLTPVGPQAVPGRGSPVEVFRLAVGP